MIALALATVALYLLLAYLALDWWLDARQKRADELHVMPSQREFRVR